jgi:hypothetical protein
VSFRAVVGLLLVAKLSFVRGDMCRRCAARAFVRAQLITLIFGSLSVLAPVMVPIALTMNEKELLPTRWLPDRYDVPRRAPCVHVLSSVACALGLAAVSLAAVAAWFAPVLAGKGSATLFVVLLTAILGALVGPAAFCVHHARLVHLAPKRTDWR